MKTSILSIFICGTMNVLSQVPCPPTSPTPTTSSPPNQLCYDYDRAGNRIGQNPAWIFTEDPYYCPEITCTPNNPEFSSVGYRRNYIYPPQGDVEYLNFINPYIDPSVAVLWIYRPIGLGDDGGIITQDPPLPERSTGNDKSILDLSIIPNPNVGQFRVDMKGFDPENTIIRIFDYNGRHVFEREYVNGEVNISEFATGAYLLLIQDKINTKSTRFIKKE